MIGKLILRVVLILTPGYIVMMLKEMGGAPLEGRNVNGGVRVRF